MNINSIRYRYGFTVLTLMLLCGNAAATLENYPGQAPDRRILKTQAKVDELFEQGQFERAMLIYRSELAAVGDKFAQYMVGYMYLTGKGVAEDPVEALAWYKLAAERGDESYVRVREILIDTLDEDQHDRAEIQYRELSGRIGDYVLMTGLIRSDLDTLKQRTRVDPVLAQQQVQRQNFGQNDTYYRQVADRLETRIEFLRTMAFAEEPPNAAKVAAVERLEAEVRREVDAARSLFK